MYKDVVLIGGGHSHALVLLAWGQRPLPGVRLTVISIGQHSVYSGMLPGVIAGHYALEESRIDLDTLCQFAGARWINAEVIGIERHAQQIQMAGRPNISYDLVSIDIGACAQQDIPGVAQYTLPVKPVSLFYPRWQHLLAELNLSRDKIKIGVIGAGASGIEILTAINNALRVKTKADSEIELHLFFRGADILNHYPKRLRQKVNAYLRLLGVHLHSEFEIAQIEKKALLSRDNERYELDVMIWCAAVQAAPWTRQLGVRTDKDGFIVVNRYLQSIDEATLFAVGDVAQIQPYSLPKAGVYAVRQAPVLYHNIRRALLQQPLKRYRPQSDFLSLISLGSQYAIGTRYGLTFSGHWVWRYKDKIDRRFVGKFRGV